MKIHFLLTFLLSLNICSYAQNQCSGIVLDAETLEPLPYLNIGIIGKSIGTVSSIKGEFELSFPDSLLTDSIKCSMIGYKSVSYQCLDFIQQLKEKNTILLESLTMEIKEVEISSRDMKSGILGNKTTSKSVMAGFVSNVLGNEVGVIIKTKRSPTILKKLNISIARNVYDTLKFRVNIYNLKERMPFENILNKEIIVVSTIKQGILTVDLDHYNLVMEDDFFVSLEWIEDLGEENGLQFSAAFFNSSIISRDTSQANWKRLRGAGVGFNVEARY